MLAKTDEEDMCKTYKRGNKTQTCEHHKLQMEDGERTKLVLGGTCFPATPRLSSQLLSISHCFPYWKDEKSERLSQCVRSHMVIPWWSCRSDQPSNTGFFHCVWQHQDCHRTTNRSYLQNLARHRVSPMMEMELGEGAGARLHSLMERGAQ